MANQHGDTSEPWNKGTTGNKRATKAIKAYRIQKVARLMGQGATQADIVQFAAQEWGLTRTPARKLWAEAMFEVKEQWSIDREEFGAMLLQQLNDLQKKTAGRQNDAVTLGCINAAAKIAKLFD